LPHKAAGHLNQLYSFMEYGEKGIGRENQSHKKIAIPTAF